MATDALTATHCPTCHVRVPEGTRRFCPACGAPMDAAPAAAPAPLPPMPTPLQAIDDQALPLLPNARPLLLAAAGALVGALLWAGIARLLHVEIGYVAWAVGGLAGGGAVLGGGRTTMHAVAAAVIALGGIVGGKVYGMHLLVDHQLTQLMGMVDRRVFDGMRRAAAEPVPAMPGGEVAGEVDDDEDSGLTAEQLAQIEADQARMRARFTDPDYTYEQWRDEQLTAMRSSIDLWALLREDLSAIDILFALLGISTAFGIVHRAGNR